MLLLNVVLVSGSIVECYLDFTYLGLGIGSCQCPSTRDRKEGDNFFPSNSWRCVWGVYLGEIERTVTCPSACSLL